MTSIPTLSVENHLRDKTTSNRKLTKCSILITDEKKKKKQKKQLRSKCIAWATGLNLLLSNDVLKLRTQNRVKFKVLYTKIVPCLSLL